MFDDMTPISRPGQSIRLLLRGRSILRSERVTDLGKQLDIQLALLDVHDVSSS